MASIVASFVLSATLATSAAAAERAGADDAAEQVLRRQIEELKRENARLTARVARLTVAVSNKEKRGSSDGAFERAVRDYNRKRGYAEEATAERKAEAREDEGIQRLFIRANSIDTYLYGLTPASKAKGASLSVLRDRQTDVDTVTIDGMVSYMFGDPSGVETDGRGAFLSGWVFAPFLEAHGAFAKPRSPSERSSLKSGFEAQVEISATNPSLPLARQVFTLSPYYQTDFRGEAEIVGLNGYWDPFDLDLHLGGYNAAPESSFSWFIRARGEVDVRSVYDPGVTRLADRNYAWIGGTALFQGFLFPSRTDMPSWITNRLSLIASASLFADAKSGRDVERYSATLKYKLDPNGYSSLAAEYAYGTDKDTLTKTDQYLLTLLVTY